MFSKLAVCVVFAAVISVAFFGWKLTARAAYESAQYTVIEADGRFEIRAYPDLMTAATTMRFESQGGDGSFMRLFGYISGANDQKQKVAMTVPVFMDKENQVAPGQMAFVMPKKVAERGVPQPADERVRIQTRVGGRFAVVRFAGRLSKDSLDRNEKELRAWMDGKGLVGDGDPESAGYDPPWTPGPMRRNEILIRLK
jgi:hypothetical protein